MPKKIMDRIQLETLDLFLEGANMKNLLEGKSTRDWYENLSKEQKSVTSLLVHFGAYLAVQDNILPNIKDQRQIMIDDAMIKGGESGERLLIISNRTGDAIELLQGMGVLGECGYVRQAGGSIEYGLDAAASDWIMHDLTADPAGYKAMQSGTTPRNVAKKEKELSEFYGSYMKDNKRPVGIFNTLDDNGNLLTKEEIALNIVKGLSKATILRGHK